jgi:hypothetical protein
MKITAALLKRKQACSSQVALFKELFPNGAEVTEAICAGVADKFDWKWAAQNLLSASASAEYERVCASASAEYERVCASAYAEYKRVCAPAYAEYKRVCASASAEYKRVCAPAYAEYKRVTAQTFGRLAEFSDDPK